MIFFLFASLDGFGNLCSCPCLDYRLSFRTTEQHRYDRGKFDRSGQSIRLRRTCCIPSHHWWRWDSFFSTSFHSQAFPPMRSRCHSRETDVVQLKLMVSVKPFPPLLPRAFSNHHTSIGRRSCGGMCVCAPFLQLSAAPPTEDAARTCAC